MTANKLEERSTKAWAIPVRLSAGSKRSRLMLESLTRSSLLAVAILFSAIVSAAQPPPLGPPANHAEDGTLATKTILGFVRVTAQKSIDLTNAQLRADGKSTRVSLESVTTNGGSRSQTTKANRPNSWCVLMYVTVKLKVAINNALDRRIYIPIDVEVFCDGWHNERGGTIVVRGRPGPASIEGGSDFEILGIRDYINGQVRAAYNAPMPAVTDLGFKCNTIGYANRGTATILDDDVVWDIPKVTAHHVLPTTALPKPEILVTFEKIKRLRARRFDNSVLYHDVEQITFRGFANYLEIGKSLLSMREGDELPLQLRTLTIDPKKFDKLVVIGNIEQPLGDNDKHTSFSVAAASLKFSPGQHQLQIPKWFSQIDQHTHKPLFYSEPAYELTYTVRVLGPPTSVTSHQ